MQFSNSFFARPYLTFLVAVLLAQGLYWLVLSPSSQRTSIPPEMLVNELQAAVLEAPTIEVAAAAVWEEVSPGFEHCCDKRFMAFRFTRELTEVPANDFALIAGIDTDNYHIWVNGFPLFDEGELAPDTTYHGSRLRGPIRVSRAMLRNGENEIMMISARAEADHTGLYRQAFGDYQTIVDATRKRAFMTGPFRLIVTILFGVIALFAIALTPVTKHQRLIFWVALLSGALFLDNAFSYWTGAELAPRMRVFLLHAFENMVPIALLGFVEVWSGAKSRLIRLCAVGVYIIALLVSAIAIFGFGHAGHQLVGLSSDILYFAGGIGSVAIFGWRVRSGALLDRPWEAAALSVAMVAMAAEVVFEFALGVSRNYLSYALPFVLTAFIVAILARNIRLYDSMAEFNESLNRQLKKRESEIEASFAEIRLAQRERDIAEERQRIMRDMHDGVGGQLVSLLSRAKNKDLTPKDVIEAIGESLTDLRLLIDSLESVGDSLDMALARFQEKIRPMLKARNINLVWRNELDNTAPEFAPRSILHIYRILQEAVANAANHGSPSEITITIFEARGEGLPLHISVSDNGDGFDIDAVSQCGKGILNMRSRAAILGGDLTVSSRASTGAELLLRLPRANTAQDGAKDMRNMLATN